MSHVKQHFSPLQKIRDCFLLSCFVLTAPNLSWDWDEFLARKVSECCQDTPEECDDVLLEWLRLCWLGDYGWLEGSSFFCVKKQQSCSFGVSLFAFLMFSCKRWNFGDWNGLRMYGNRVRDGSVASDFECFLLERWLLILLFPKAVLESFRQWSHTLNEHTYPLIGVFSICSFGLYLAKTSPLIRYTFRMPRPTMTDTWCFPKVTGGRLLSGFIRYDLRQNLLALRMNFLRFWDGDDPPERVERCLIRAMWLGSPA